MNRHIIMLGALLVVATLATAATAQNYRMPVQRPSSGSQPYITAHRDDDPSGAKKDYSCAQDTYNGHGGTDIGIGGFPAMDAGRNAVAAADGRVAAIRDGCFDRCTSGGCACADGFGNYVRIDHADGKRTYYGHLKRNSLRVSTGQQVTCGTVLGQVGSSGNSTGPHLHFEVRHSNNSNDDPYRGSCGGPTSYWITQGSYGSLPADSCPNTAPPPPPPPPPAVETILRGVVFEDVGVGTDDMSRRLAGANISITGTSRTTTAAAGDAAWSFTISNPGSKTIRVSAPGFETAERTCDVDAATTTWCSIGLVRTPPPTPTPEPEPEPVGEGESEGEGEGEATNPGGEGEGEGEEKPGEGEADPQGPGAGDVKVQTFEPSAIGGCQQGRGDQTSAMGMPIAAALLCLRRRRR